MKFYNAYINQYLKLFNKANKKMSIFRNINKVIKALGKTYRGLAPYAIFR
ncbi:hypothetical protein [Symbiopectobacterium purcellii]